MAQDYTRSQLAIAETSQGLERFRPYRYVREKLVGSDSDAFFYAKYGKVAVIKTGAEPEWIEVPADPDAGLIKSGHKRAVVLGVSKAAIHGIAIENHHRELTLAGAYSHKGVDHAGRLPVGITFGKAEESGEALFTIAMRMGPKPSQMSMGLVWEEPKTPILLQPSGVHIVEMGVPTVDLSDRYPGTPLI